jgi:Ser/Thr protein kinase RdoA (MazF antagonist)
VARGRVSLIDFQDVIRGFEIMDVVFAHHALKVQFPEREELGGAFRAGYEEIRPWPGADREVVAALVAARHLNVLNFGLSVRGPGLDEFVARHARPVVAWMTG